MPTYQYACTECHHAFDQVQKFSDDALTVCPECQGRLRKVYNAVGVVFKGSGFYRNDSRSTSSSSVPAVEGGSDKSEKKADKKSDAKPATKSESSGSSSGSSSSGSSSSGSAASSSS
ncbi:FmdB family transcriptional regulator [Nocardioides dongxiaopingii]|uniref:FmdB family zinc ribbon protein n=1 Tax=Nocardioides sp. S-1144 TaxID=2582905 RepID=UPI00110E022A|nr:FmdB family zinc ribbon protein [Nocardioides sp. S-1144]QCW51621.1 FmdB family transcriptional regulator [Nocardioides sp. S-1144]